MKYCGLIGFAETKKTSLDVFEEQITERKYYGDVIKNVKQYETTDTLNDNINVRNSISIIADPFAYEHFFNMRYICWMGSRWIIKNVDVQRPRLILTIGGVYNGPLPKQIIENTPSDTGE